MAKIIADFRTSLATKLAVGGTSFTLQSATDDDGVALPSGKYYFTCDGENSQKEHFYCDLAGTVATNVESVSRQGVKTSGAVREHRVGATLTITDFAHIKDIADFVDKYDGKWMGAVADYAALVALTGSVDGEVRVTLDDSKIYVYDLDTTTWNLAGAGGGAGTVYRTTLLGTESTGGDNKTFTLTSGSFPDKKYFQVYKNGVLMGEGATNDYVATGSNQAVFNEAVLDDDVIDLLVISVDLYNPAWNQVNGDILPDVDDAYDIGSTTKKFKDLNLSGNANIGGNTTFGEIPVIPTTTPTSSGQVIALDADAKLPAVDGSNLTNLDKNEVFTLVASDNLRAKADKISATITGTTPTKVKEILLNDVGGTVRITFQLRTPNGAGHAIARIYKNGVAYGAEITEWGTSFVAKSTDLVFSSGDLIQCYLYGSLAETTSSLAAFRLLYDKQPAVITNTVNLD